MAMQQLTGMHAHSKALTGQAEMFSGAEVVALKPPNGDLVHKEEPHLTGLSRGLPLRGALLGSDAVPPALLLPPIDEL